MFESFFLAGFECATGYNAHGEWIDQVAATQHDTRADEDYDLLRRHGIRAARDAARWPLVEQDGRYNFSSLRSRLDAARKNGVEVIWDLFHYGYPEDLDPFSVAFAERFADYCFAVGRYIAARTDGQCYFTPINEPSFFAWAGGEAGLFAPHQRGRGSELKVSLARAAIRGIDALRAAVPECRIVNVDPVCRVVAPRGRPELEPEAQHFNERSVWESYDMLCGRLHPELGGSRSHLDVVGVNYYWTNQWELQRTGIPLAADDPRRRPLRELLRSVHDRYGGALLITETAHRDEHRPGWIRELAGECEAVLDEGVPLRGACLYPVLGMPEWHSRSEWTRMGLWDLVHDGRGLARVPYLPALEALAEASRLNGRQHAADSGAPLAGVR